MLCIYPAIKNGYMMLGGGGDLRIFFVSTELNLNLVSRTLWAKYRHISFRFNILDEQIQLANQWGFN